MWDPYEVWYRRYIDSESSDSDAGGKRKKTNEEPPPPPPPPEPEKEPWEDPDKFDPVLKEIPVLSITMQRHFERVS